MSALESFLNNKKLGTISPRLFIYCKDTCWENSVSWIMAYQNLLFHSHSLATFDDCFEWVACIIAFHGQQWYNSKKSALDSRICHSFPQIMQNRNIFVSCVTGPWIIIFFHCIFMTGSNPNDRPKQSQEHCYMLFLYIVPIIVERKPKLFVSAWLHSSAHAFKTSEFFATND